jgi:serine protease
MYRSRVAFVALCLTILGACGDGPTTATTSEQAEVALASGRFVAGEAIVKLGRPLVAGVAVEVAGLRLTPIHDQPSGAWLVSLDDAKAAADRGDHKAAEAATADAVDALAADSEVEYAYPNLIAELQRIPRDERWPDQAWHYEAIRLPAAWDLTVGSGGVRIAVIDSGTALHPELVNRFVPGWDFVDNDPDPTDGGFLRPDGSRHWFHHGIHVAGIIGSETDAPARGTAGICWNCALVPARALTVDGVERAIAWAASPAGGNARVINMSLAFRDRFGNQVACSRVPGLRTAIAAAIAGGVVVIASAGNFGAGSPELPANCPDVVSVGATQPSRALATYSNRGPSLDLVAPGGAGAAGDHSMYGPGFGCAADGDVYSGLTGSVSTWVTDRAPELRTSTDYCARNLSGTSMSAPHVTGVVGLMLSVKPSLTPAQVQQILVTTATVDPDRLTCAPGQCGAGLLDAHAAVRAARDGLSPDLELAPTTIAFGDQLLQTVSAPRPLVIRNLGTVPLVASINAPSPQLRMACGAGAGTCTCATSTSCAVTVAAGAQRALDLRYAPTTVAALAVALTVTSNDPDEASVAVGVTGNATFSRLVLEPPVVDFGNVQVGHGSIEQWVTTRNTGTAPLLLSGFALSDRVNYAATSDQPLPVTLEPGSGVFFRVTCTPLAVGARPAAITFQTDGTTPAQALTLGCTGALPTGVLTLDPRGLAFGKQPVGTTASRELRVANTTPATTFSFELTRPAAPFALSCVQGCLCVPGRCFWSGIGSTNDAVLSLRYSPTTAVSDQATLDFTSSDPGLPGTTLATSGTGGYDELTLVEPARGRLMLSPSNLSGRVIMHNASPSPVRIDGWRIDQRPANADAFSIGDAGVPLPYTLAPGATIEWKVRCTPTWRTGTHATAFLLDTQLGIGHRLVEVTCTMDSTNDESFATRAGSAR